MRDVGVDGCAGLEVLEVCLNVGKESPAGLHVNFGFNVVIRGRDDGIDEGSSIGILLIQFGYAVEVTETIEALVDSDSIGVIVAAEIRGENGPVDVIEDVIGHRIDHIGGEVGNNALVEKVEVDREIGRFVIDLGVQKRIGGDVSSNSVHSN